MKILRLTQVKEMTGLSRSTIYSKIKNNEFPKQINLGPRIVGWLEEEIEQWLITRIKNRSNPDK